MNIDQSVTLKVLWGVIRIEANKVNRELACEVASHKSKLKKLGKESPTLSSTEEFCRNGKTTTCASSSKTYCAGAVGPGNVTSAASKKGTNGSNKSNFNGK